MIDDKKIYYLAGPMTGRPFFNFPMFEAVKKMLDAEGYTIVSPTELDDKTDYEQATSNPEGDIKVDGVIVLPGWEASKGARLEVFVATCQGKQILEYDPYEHALQKMYLPEIGAVFKDYVDQHYAKEG